MRKESTDLRVKRTTRSIRQAFYELVLVKDYSQISITELADRAYINRKTFYLHYSSLDELMKELEEEMAQDMLEHLEKDAKNLDVAGCISVFYHYLNNGDELHKRLLCSESYHFFYSGVVDHILHSEFFQRFYDRTRHPDLVRAYCVGITGIFRTWYNHPGDMTIEELISYAGRLMVRGYESVVE